MVLSRTHQLLSAYWSHSAVEGHIHVASRSGSHRFFCQGHLLHPTGRNLSAKPESGITSSEKPSVTSPAEPTVSCSAPIVPGRGASRHPSATLSPTSTPYDQIPLDLALLAGTELTPLVPVATGRGPALVVTAIRWMQKFVGRAESTLPFATSAYLHLTTDYFSLQMEDFYQKTSVLVTQRHLQRRAGPVSCLGS